MKRWLRVILNICITMAVSTAMVTVVFADSADALKAEKPLTEDGIIKSWASYDGFVHEQTFTNDYYLNGLFSQCTEYFNTGDWEIHDAAFVLNYNETQLLQREVSDLTVSLNGEPVYSAHVPDSDGGNESLVIKLPVTSIKADSANNLKIEVYLRGEAAEVCVDDTTNSKWMNVFKESKTLVSYTPKAPCENIAQFYKQFTSIDALENKQSAICVPTGADESIYTAAAVAASGISGNAVLYYDNIALRGISSTEDLKRYKYAIYISSYDKLYPEISDLLTEQQNKAAQSSAVCALLRVNDSNILVVTGSNVQAIANAGRMLANSDYSLELNTQTKAIGAQENYIVQAQALQQYVALTQSGVSVKGSFRQSAEFYIDYPANRTIAPSSELSLDLRYSENLDFDRSLVTVYLNNIPIGSKKLTLENAKGDTAVFPIPDDLEITGSFSVKVAFDLDVGEEWCRLSPEEMPWGYVVETSMLKLSSTDNARMIFDNYPSPFLRDGSINKMAIVISDEPSEADLEVLRLLMLTIGQFQKDNAGSLRVAFYSKPGDLSTENVIAIGRIYKNKIAQEKANNLYFKFDAAGKTVLSNKQMLIDPEYGQTIGIAQLLDSPYSERVHSLLIISGVTDQAMLRAAAFLGSTNKLWQLSGDGYAADENQAHCFVFVHDKTEQPAPVTETITETTKVYSFALVAGAALLLCLLALLMIILKYTRRKRP